MPRHRARLCLIGVLALWTVPALAAEPIVGSVIALRGEVFREVGGDRRPIAVKEPIHLADTIVSGTGKAKILLNDGTVISLGENTRITISQYQSAKNNLKTGLSLWSGALRLFVNRASSGGQFEIETETATAAVRGTDWAIEASPDKTSVVVFTGSVAVSGRGPFSGATTTLDAPGLGTDVNRGAAPTPVRRWGDQRIANILARASFE